MLGNAGQLASHLLSRLRGDEHLHAPQGPIIPLCDEGAQHLQQAKEVVDGSCTQQWPVQAPGWLHVSDQQAPLPHAGWAGSSARRTQHLHAVAITVPLSSVYLRAQGRCSTRCCLEFKATRSRSTHRHTMFVSRIDPPWWWNGHHGMGKIAEYIDPAPVVQAVVVYVAGALWEGCKQSSEHVRTARAACAGQQNKGQTQPAAGLVSAAAPGSQTYHRLSSSRQGRDKPAGAVGPGLGPSEERPAQDAYPHLSSKQLACVARCPHTQHP